MTRERTTIRSEATRIATELLAVMQRRVLVSSLAIMGLILVSLGFAIWLSGLLPVWGVALGIGLVLLGVAYRLEGGRGLRTRPCKQPASPHPDELPTVALSESVPRPPTLGPVTGTVAGSSALSVLILALGALVGAASVGVINRGDGHERGSTRQREKATR